MKNPTVFVIISLLIGGACTSQATQSNEEQAEKSKVSVKVDFTSTLQDWDGFGINYVEVAQSTDPITDPQEYGGFSRLTEKKRMEILRMIFGEDGLKPNIIKMFLGPHHQKEPGGMFDHESTTFWMRYFARKGIDITKGRGGRDIEIITTMYGPPAWATKQKILRGRDLDPEQFKNLAAYMIDWVRFLVEKENLPVKYLSLHNEGDSPHRWPLDGSRGNLGSGRDYNAFWRPAQVAHFLDFMPPMLRAAGLDVGLTPGETTNWRNFAGRWYHWAIHDNENAVDNIALITSHSFGTGNAIDSRASDLLRLKRPELHSWTTSMTWGGKNGMKDYEFLNIIRRNIYEAEVNSVIPWAALQTLTWVDGDPNPGTAFFVSEEGEYEVKPQYYYYKQLCPIGQRGMKVTKVESEEGSNVELIAFSSNGTDNPDAFLLMNLGEIDKEIVIEVTGSGSAFSVIRSGESEQFVKIGDFEISEGKIVYRSPAGSVSTFVAM